MCKMKAQTLQKRSPIKSPFMVVLFLRSKKWDTKSLFMHFLCYFSNILCPLLKFYNRTILKQLKTLTKKSSFVTSKSCTVEWIT